jgi:hypothetical protein
MSFQNLPNTATTAPVLRIALLLVMLILLPGCQLYEAVLAKHHKQPEIVLPPRTITVTGIVRNTGQYELPEIGGLTIQQAIAQAGGMMPATASLVASPAVPANFSNEYASHWEKLAVTIRRGQITYVLPAQLVESTEYGRIRLIDRDVIAVLPLREAGFDVDAKGEPANRFEANSLGDESITINGATVLANRVSSISDLEALLSPQSLNGRILFNTTLDKSVVGKVFDRSRTDPAMFARVLRRATVDGQPRIFIFPIKYSAEDDGYDRIRNSYNVIGGDTITYLPAGTDPLVLISELSEDRLRRTLGRLHSDARR